MVSEKLQGKILRKLVLQLTRKFSPGVIQKGLAHIYEEYSIASKTEPEAEFWLKCGRSSNNLASGMDKWAGDMLDELETGEENETEHG